MTTSTEENYLKAIYILEKKHTLAATGAIAKYLQVTPGSVTVMVQSLQEKGYLNYQPRKGVCLTSSGKQIALNILRRHRLIEYFLVKIIGLDWSEIHEEAERLEHVLSDRTIEKIDALLDHPRFDPHGDPIPSAKGNMAKTNTFPLTEGAINKSYKITRVQDSDTDFLQFLNQHQLILKKRITILRKDPIAETIEIQNSEQSITLGYNAAKKIELEKLS